MSTNESLLMVSDIPVQVIRKKIKNLHLAVYPPEGQVRVSAPLRMNDDYIRMAIAAHLPWIKKQKQKFQHQPRQTAREFVSGETHFLWGVPYRLDVSYQAGKSSLKFAGEFLYLTVPPNSTCEVRERVLTQFYRLQLKQRINALLVKWQPIIQVSVTAWGVRRMKTKWGSCNTVEKRIWLNSELVKKSPECLEFVVVHELVHLLERHHNAKFYAHMDNYLPMWREVKKQLNQEHLAHEHWQHQE